MRGAYLSFASIMRAVGTTAMDETRRWTLCAKCIVLPVRRIPVRQVLQRWGMTLLCDKEYDAVMCSNVVAKK